MNNCSVPSGTINVICVGRPLIKASLFYRRNKSSCLPVTGNRVLFTLCFLWLGCYQVFDFSSLYGDLRIFFFFFLTAAFENGYLHTYTLPSICLLAPKSKTFTLDLLRKSLLTPSKAQRLIHGDCFQIISYN